jgi:Protein of unknown function (DUF3237)
VLKVAAALALTGCASPKVVASSTADLAIPRERKLRMNSRPLMTLRIATAALQDVGAASHGSRSIFPITGGSFEGDRLRGQVWSGGDDWMLLRADGVRELDLRITLETDDGALIYMTFAGMRHGAATDPGGEYFRTLPRFETAATKYEFLNKLLAVGVGEARADGPVHLIEEIL